LNYDDKKYDEVEEELHLLEDDFQEKYGEYLDDAFSYVHDEFCADDDVLLPIAYVANEYKIENGKFDVDINQGVLVDVDDYPGKSTKLVLVPSPPRILLLIDENTREVAWSTED